MLLPWHLGERFKWLQMHDFQFLSQYEHWFNYHLILYYNDVCLISRWMLFCSKILSGSRWHKSCFDYWCLLRSGYVYWSSCHSLSYNFYQGWGLAISVYFLTKNCRTLLKIGLEEIGLAYRNFSSRFEESYSHTFDFSEKFAFWDLFFGIGVM